MTKPVSIEACQELLEELGFDLERCNIRSARVLLSLLGLEPGDAWIMAKAPMLRTVEIMAWIRKHWGFDYKPNTRETVRRQTLHQFSLAHVVVQNPDEPSRPINSPKWCYQVTSDALDVIRAFGSIEFQSKLSEYRSRLPGLQEQYRSERDMLKIPVDLPGGVRVELSAGGQNTLLKSMIDEFCSQFTPGGTVLYVGDAGDKWLVCEEEILASLGVTVDQHGIMPDLVVYMEDRNWIVLLEAVSSHGPVDGNRHIQLKQLFKRCSAGLIFVSCFPDQATMKRYLTDISWETEVWTADHPTHLVHFDGERFLGPYEA